MIPLNALEQNNPQAILAAYGVVRLCAIHNPVVTMHWRDGVPFLDGISREEVIYACVAHLQDRDSRDGLVGLEGMAKLTGVPVDCYRHIPSAWRDHYFYVDKPKFDKPVTVFRHGKWTVLKPDARKKYGKANLLRTSPLFDIAGSGGGNVQMLGVMRKVVADLQTRNAEHRIDAAIFESWSRSDMLTSIGLDPVALNIASNIKGENDTESPKSRRMEAAAQWLAFESIPLFPARWICRYGDGISIVIPTSPVTYSCIRSFVPTGAHGDYDRLLAMGWQKMGFGVIAIDKSRCFDFAVPARTPSGREITAGSRTNAINNLRANKLDTQRYVA